MMNKNKSNAAGWLPSSSTRTGSGAPGQPEPSTSHDNDEYAYSMFPIENEDLVYGAWEDEVIWDAEVS